MIGFAPPQASSFAPRIDMLFNAMLVLCSIVALGVFVVMIWFCIKYRRGSPAERGQRESSNLTVELSWTLIPFLMFCGLFGWSLYLWDGLRTPPHDASTVYVVGKQWMWKIQHPGGQREIDQLHLPLGVPTRLVMTSQDVIHSFYVPAFRIKQDLLPGRYTQMWFTPTETGTFDLMCAEFCGTDHAAMRGEVVVMRPDDYARWMQSHAQVGLAERGEMLFRRFGCSGCHGSGATVHAPDLDGIYGTTVALTDGSVATVDDRYLHDSIMLPKSQVVAGYAPIMPSYENRIGEEDVLALLAYIKSTQQPGPHPTEPSHERH
ncbi:cytochrome c oxidase subunit II [Dyella sp.]|jgi:cytochrome c oxidase subunit 2|uniref:cytochrome c oxidase subunit II n=1 Tax=Dyella sp. TaxID=1869338 RepID=UPI002D7881F0|nr:cytochrome c oxidase subunit II [Dyella sp.]HET6432786.1 cytochrome c oxidase subunit II [Dyella sp.]